MPTSPDGISSRPQLSPQDINSGGGGGADPTFAGVEFVPAAAGSMTSKLVSALREDANQKVGVRCLSPFFLPNYMPAHPMGVLILHPREMQILWRQTDTQRKQSAFVRPD